jgi:hypothetical protein
MNTVLSTTGNGVFAERNTLWWEPNLELSAKSSSPRVKKIILGEEKNSRWRYSSPRAKKILSAKNSSPRASLLALGKEILRREYFICSRRSNF